MRSLIYALAILAPTCVFAHDIGCDGKPVPANIKSSCCGAADAHLINDSNLQPDINGSYIVTIDGIRRLATADHVLPSPDGCYWVFYSNSWIDSPIWCLLIPFNF